MDFKKLSEDERNVLCGGIRFDPAKYDIYRFFVAPVFIMGKRGKKRRRRRKSYTNVNRVLIQVKVPSSEIQLLGIYPVSRLQTGSHDSRSGFSLPIVGKLRVGGRAKDAVKRGQHMIIASRTDEIAQWVFLKPYIESSEDFRMQVLCIVSTDLDEEERFIRCNASFQDKGREIEGAYSRRIELPAA